MDSRFPHGERGPPPQLEEWQHGEEVTRQQQKIDKKEKSICEERRPAPILRTEFQRRQAVGAPQIEDHKIEVPLKTSLHRKEGHGRSRWMPYGEESKIRVSPGPLGSPPDFLAFDPDSPKWGDAKAGEGRSQYRGQSKVRSPAGRGPEVSCSPPRLPGLKANNK